MKLSAHQWRLLHACVARWQHSTATIQNTTRSLVRAGLVERYRVRGRVLIRPTDAGRKEWFVQMRARQVAGLKP